MEKKRLDYLDMVKGFGILLVVLGHMQDIATGTRIWISSFHMPLFFIVSGLLMAVKNEEAGDFKLLVNKKFRGIIIPYLWFSLSYFLIDILNVTVIGNIDGRTFVVDTISSLTFYGMSVLWFLPCLFIASISFIYLKKKLPDKITLFLLIAVSLLSYLIKLELQKLYDLHVDSIFVTSMINVVYIFLRANIALSFVGYAYYIRKGYESLLLKAAENDSLATNKRAKDKSAGDFLCNVAGLIEKNRIVCFLLGLLMLIINIMLSLRNECCDLRNILLNNIAIYFMGAFLGTYGIILIMKAMPVSKLITYFGRNSIIVMAAHVNYYFLYAGIRLAWVIDPFVKHAKHYVFVAIVLVTVFALCFVAIEVIKRFFPFVLGKPFKKK